MDDSIIMLQDENGNMIEFEAIDCFEFNHVSYLLWVCLFGTPLWYHTY